MPDLTERFYAWCLARRTPYFGTHMWALQGLRDRHRWLQALVRVVAEGAAERPLAILEAGSWAGGSAITFAEAVKREHRRGGRVLCVDAWTPFFDPAQQDATNPVYSAMASALARDEIFALFRHNIETSGHADVVDVLKGRTRDVLPLLRDRTFDVVFIDADHRYPGVRRDLEAGMRLVADGGILCGDDLELQADEVGMARVRDQAAGPYEFVAVPGTARYYHPGVTLAVRECLGRVSSWHGLFAMRRRGERWEPLDLAPRHVHGLTIPAHLQGDLARRYREFADAVLADGEVALGGAALAAAFDADPDAPQGLDLLARLAVLEDPTCAAAANERLQAQALRLAARLVADGRADDATRILARCLPAEGAGA